ncbi:MAG: 16S rRNA (uracil(1498)-N(3))-methyltransferase [Gammaproteobacteria bacterium]
MRIPRIHTPQPLVTGQTMELEAVASRHLLTVLRLKPGAELVLFNGSGHEFEARLDAVENRRARISIGIERGSRSESPLRITLAQGISRSERMDYTLQKAVELGVAEIVPVLTERSVVRLDANSATRKQNHWRQLVISACEQSGRVHLPAVRAPLSFDALLTQAGDYAMKLLLDPQATARLNALDHPAHQQVLLLVGPEGGLSEAERGAARHAGFQGVRLGPRILRTETAALVALSLLQGLWGDLSGV